MLSYLEIYKKRELFLLAFLILTGVLLIFCFINKGTPSVDAGVHYYVGSRVLHGEVPYRDVFDNKPPIIYFVNALGLSISGGKAWGVWIVEAISLSVAIFYSFISLKKVFNLESAFYGTLLWILAFMSLFDGGNLTEEYALPFQFMGIYLFIRSVGNKTTSVCDILLGVGLGITFFIKQNTFGIFLTSILIILSLSLVNSRWKTTLLKIRSYAIGLLISLLVVIGYLSINHALDDFISFAYTMNFYQFGRPFSNAANVIYRGFQLLLPTMLITIAIVGWADALAILIYRVRRNYLNKTLYVLIFMTVAFPTELLLVSTSNKIYTHYYVTWLPVLSLLVGYVLFSLLRNLSHFLLIINKETSVLQLRWVYLTIVTWIIYLTIATFRSGFEKAFLGLSTVSEVERYILTNTSRVDSVLVWGIAPALNFVTERESPTRYNYQSPLYVVGFQNRKMYDEFLNSIKLNKPKLILDSDSSSGRFTRIRCDGINEVSTKFSDFKPLPEMREIVDYICLNYTEKGVVGGWRVFEVTK